MDMTLHTMDILGGHLITKEKRQELYGRVSGGRGSRGPEEYQRSQIIHGTGFPCPTTSMRINYRRNVMEPIATPMRHPNGYDYTENFDGMQVIGHKTIWINLKCVVGKGGSQTRTLRDECYHFVEYQLQYLLTHPGDYFANIFDGDEAAHSMPKFHYLLDLPDYITVKKYVYVGDLKDYFEWIK